MYSAMLEYIVYGLAASMVIHFMVVLIYGFVIRFLMHFLSRQKEIHKRVQVLVGEKTNIMIEGAITVVGFGKGIKPVDDPSRPDVFLILLAGIGLLSYIMARARGKGYICDLLIVFCTSCNLCVMAISSLHFLLSPYSTLPIFLGSLLMMVFLVYIKVSLIDGVNLSIQQIIPPTSDEAVPRTQVEEHLEGLVGNCLAICVAIAVALLSANALWTDVERDYRRGIKWISVLDFLTYVFMVTARLFDKGSVYQGVVLSRSITYRSISLTIFIVSCSIRV